MTERSEQNRWWLNVGLVFVAAVVIVDVCYPLGPMIVFAYVLVALTGFFASARDAIVLAAAATAANVFAYCIAPSADVPEYIVQVNRYASVFITWLLIVTGLHFHRYTQAVILTIAESNERRRLALEGAELGFWDQNLVTGEMNYDNDWIGKLGYAPNEVQPTAAWYEELIHPDDRRATNLRWKRHLAGEDPRIDVEQRLRTNTGQWRFVVTKGRVIARDESGKPVRAAGTHLDVTEAHELKLRAEQAQRDRIRELHLITDAIPMMIGYLDENERFQFNNAAYEQVYGLPLDAFKGKSYCEVVGEEAYDRLRPHVVAALKGRREQCEEQIFLPDGIHWWLIQFLPRTVDDIVVGFYSLVTDVSGLKHSQDEVDRQREALAISNNRRAINEMTAVLAHEINQPLMTIAIYTGRLLEQLTDGTADPAIVVRAMDRMHQEALRAGQIVKKARAMVDEKPIERAPIDPHDLLEAVQKLCGPRAAGARVAIELKVEPSADTVYADMVQMQQVLVNLVNNAIDASQELDKSRKRIVVSIESCGEGTEVSVVDRGHGLSQERLQRVFEPRYSTKPGGLGIGLNICRSIVAMHGGRMWASQNEGVGVTFHVFLPHKPLDAQMSDIAASLVLVGENT